MAGLSVRVGTAAALRRRRLIASRRLPHSPHLAPRAPAAAAARQPCRRAVTSAAPGVKRLGGLIASLSCRRVKLPLPARCPIDCILAHRADWMRTRRADAVASARCHSPRSWPALSLPLLASPSLPSLSIRFRHAGLPLRWRASACRPPRPLPSYLFHHYTPSPCLRRFRRLSAPSRLLFLSSNRLQSSTSFTFLVRSKNSRLMARRMQI